MCIQLCTYIYIYIDLFMYLFMYIYDVYLYTKYIYIYVYKYTSLHILCCKNASSHIHVPGSTRTAVDAISVAWAAQGASRAGRGWPEPFASDFRACQGRDRGRSNLDILLSWRKIRALRCSGKVSGTLRSGARVCYQL